MTHQPVVGADMLDPLACLHIVDKGREEPGVALFYAVNKKEIRVTRALAIASSGVSFGMAEERLVLAYCDGTVFSFERARERSESVFGGPMRAEPSGIEHGPKPLHMIARLGSLHLPVLRRHHLLDIPLIYGMCYDGCRVEYRIDFGGKIELRELRPTQSSEDWPYPHFPPLLPYVPLQIGDTRRCSYAEFAQAFPNMPNAQPSELVVAVPPPATLGVSLWDSGDDEGVTILFECDLADRVVAASNLCS